MRGSRIVITDMSANWTRTGFVRIVERMGGIVIGDLEAPRPGEIVPDEPVCELDVASGPLVGTVVEPSEVPLAIDELPLVALLACFAEGETVVRGAAERLLRFDAAEQPLALQLGGSDPSEMAAAARIGADLGFSEININVGCPSDKVQSGRFGACLMARPDTVAACVRAMRAVTDVPVTVKTRIGIDDHDSVARRLFESGTHGNLMTEVAG